MRIELRDIGARFADAPWLFRHLDLLLEPGRTYALTGPSGCGKSSLLGLIAGWSIPTEGGVFRDGISKTSWVFQNSHGTPRRLAIDHVVFPLLAAGRPRAEAEGYADQLLAKFAVHHIRDRAFRELSGGESQRLMLARAVAADPDVLLIDEPTAQLDSATSRTVNDAMTELGSAGRIVLIASHDPDTVAACSDRIDLPLWAPSPGSRAS